VLRDELNIELRSLLDNMKPLKALELSRPWSRGRSTSGRTSIKLWEQTWSECLKLRAGGPAYAQGPRLASISRRRYSCALMR